MTSALHVEGPGPKWMRPLHCGVSTSAMRVPSRKVSELVASVHFNLSIWMLKTLFIVVLDPGVLSLQNLRVIGKSQENTNTWEVPGCVPPSVLFGIYFQLIDSGTGGSFNIHNYICNYILYVYSSPENSNFPGKKTFPKNALPLFWWFSNDFHDTGLAFRGRFKPKGWADEPKPRSSDVPCGRSNIFAFRWSYNFKKSHHPWMVHLRCSISLT